MSHCTQCGAANGNEHESFCDQAPSRVMQQHDVTIDNQIARAKQIAPADAGYQAMLLAHALHAPLLAPPCFTLASFVAACKLLALHPALDDRFAQEILAKRERYHADVRADESRTRFEITLPPMQVRSPNLDPISAESRRNQAILKSSAPVFGDDVTLVVQSIEHKCEECGAIAQVPENQIERYKDALRCFACNGKLVPTAIAEEKSVMLHERTVRSLVEYLASFARQHAGNYAKGEREIAQQIKDHADFGTARDSIELAELLTYMRDLFYTQKASDNEDQSKATDEAKDRQCEAKTARDESA